jgi:hypothetical protein
VLETVQHLKNEQNEQSLDHVNIFDLAEPTQAQLQGKLGRANLQERKRQLSNV